MAAQNAPVNPHPQLPDFAVIANHANQALTGLLLLQNLPVLDNGAQILARLNTVVTRLDVMDGRFNTIDGQFNGINTRLDALNVRIDNVDNRITNLDTSVAGFGARLRAMCVSFLFDISNVNH
jgi:hypothetical protein